MTFLENTYKGVSLSRTMSCNFSNFAIFLTFVILLRETELKW